MSSDEELSKYGWQAKTYSVSEIPPDKYTILSYESKKTKYGKTYIISCTSDDGETVLSFWANSYLSEYIQEYKPKKKFDILIQDGKVDILGFSRRTNLK